MSGPGRIRLRRTAKALGLAVLLVAGSIGSYFGLIQIDGNFHAVEEGRFYRSAQLDKSELRQAIEKHGIKSILNLRGANPGKAWYDNEIAVSATLGVAHYDYGLSASRFVTPGQIDGILKVIRAAPKPILVHCKSGADRAGLVSALYEAEIEGRTLEDADRQLSLVYGHFPYLTSKTGAMDRSFWAYVNAH